MNNNKKAPFCIKADNCYLSENNTYGEVNLSEEDNKKHPEYMCQSGKIKWNLNISKKIAFNVLDMAQESYLEIFKHLKCFGMQKV